MTYSGTLAATVIHFGAEVPEDGAPAFPAEHYGCPPWCEVNSSPGPDPANHDSADGMPDWPGFDGYHHSLTFAVPYASAELFTTGGEICRNPLVVALEQEPGDAEPSIKLLNEEESLPVKLALTLDEAQHLAAALGWLLAAAR